MQRPWRLRLRSCQLLGHMARVRTLLLVLLRSGEEACRRGRLDTPGHATRIAFFPRYWMVFFPVDNARPIDFNANDVGYVPSKAPHYIENTGDTDLAFLETFASDEFMDVSLNQWLAA